MRGVMRGRATAIVREGPDPTVAILLASLNDAFDAGTEQRWAFVDPIPAEIIWLLLAMSVFAIGALGCQIALRRRRHPAGGMYSYEPGSRSFEPIDGSVAGRMIARKGCRPKVGTRPRSSCPPSRQEVVLPHPRQHLPSGPTPSQTRTGGDYSATTWMRFSS
jgi:hypothetical protein